MQSSLSPVLRRLRCDRCDEAATVVDRGFRLCGDCFLQHTLRCVASAPAGPPERRPYVGQPLRLS